MEKCKAKTIKGSQCTNSTKKDSEFCGLHSEGYSGGRPTSYLDEYAEQAYQLALLGATDRDVADFFEVTEETINQWKKKEQEFSESLTRGKDIADAQVAHSFYKRALGYEFEEVREEFLHGSKVASKRTITKKHIPSDTSAALSWLKNRQPKKWRDKSELDISAVLGSYDMSQLTDQQLQRIAKGEHPSVVLAMSYYY